LSKQASIDLVVGLGNHGPEYEFTRHNIGWLAIDQVSNIDPDSRWKNKFKGIYTSLNFNGRKVYFLKPQTYMNLSGESAGPLAKFFKIPKENILVVHDEVDLPYGTIAFKKGGGLAGHNGLKSLNSHLGGPDFMRLRLGVGKPTRGEVSSWVLGSFSKTEEKTLGEYLATAAAAIELSLEKGYEKAASEYSRKNILKE